MIKKICMLLIVLVHVTFGWNNGFVAFTNEIVNEIDKRIDGLTCQDIVRGATPQSTGNSLVDHCVMMRFFAHFERCGNNSGLEAHQLMAIAHTWSDKQLLNAYVRYSIMCALQKHATQVVVS